MEMADEGDHLDDHGAIIVQERCERSRDGDAALQFLADLPDDGGGGLLAGLNLAAGKFPFARQVLVVRALGQQHPPLVLDHGADHGDGDLGRHGVTAARYGPGALQCNFGGSCRVM